jgi:hypothetical protein
VRFQSTQASCGPAALRNALLCVGVTRTESELETLTGCTASEGTTPKGLQTALQAIGRQGGTISEGRGDVAILRLLEALRNGRPVILLVDHWDHWVVAFGLLGVSSIHLVDSADTELVQTLTPEELIPRWEGNGKRPYYGIIV